VTEDSTEGPRILAHLVSSRTPEQKRQRLAELTDTGPFIPPLTYEAAKRGLKRIACAFGD
jgi:hypothetical protein